MQLVQPCVHSLDFFACWLHRISRDCKCQFSSTKFLIHGVRLVDFFRNQSPRSEQLVNFPNLHPSRRSEIIFNFLFLNLSQCSKRILTLQFLNPSRCSERILNFHLRNPSIVNFQYLFHSANRRFSQPCVQTADPSSSPSRQRSRILLRSNLLDTPHVDTHDNSEALENHLFT